MNTAEYDYIVVGAGSSGCVVAERLSADGITKVLLVEAGGRNETELVNMPRAFMKMFGNPVHFWHFPVKEQEGRPAGEVWPYGRGLGGSSSTNGTWYMRGVAADYESWPSPQSEWSWEQMLRCFTEMESYQDPGADLARGRDGPLQITQLPYRSPVISAIIEAGGEMGLEKLDDINTPDKVGIGYTQATVSRRGRRASSYQAFLKPAMARSNLTVMTDTRVERVEIDGSRATGIWISSADGSRFIGAAREVILSAGAIQSPKLLQLSGVGDPAVLKAAGVPLRHSLGSVGQNLADHAMFSMSFRLHGDMGANREFGGWRLMTHVLRYYLTRKGWMAYTSPEVTALLSMRSSPEWPDVQFGVGPFSMRSSEERKADPGRGALESEPGITVNAIALRLKSRGTVLIRSDEPDELPEIDACWWSDSDDMVFMVEMAQLVRTFMRQPALQPFVGDEIIPGERVKSDEDLAKSLEWLTSPGIHATGTCRMGEPGDSVVDSRLRVHGITGLRIVDCSIMPAPPAGNTNGPAMAIGWRAAELIREDRRTN